MRAILNIIFLLIFIQFSGMVMADGVPVYEKAKKRNPFIPLITNDGQFTNIKDDEENNDLILEGIIYDKEGKSMAIINGQILGKGDTIAAAKIVEIRKDSVVYAKDGEIFIIYAKKEEE